MRSSKTESQSRIMLLLYNDLRLMSTFGLTKNSNNSDIVSNLHFGLYLVILFLLALLKAGVISIQASINSPPSRDLLKTNFSKGRTISRQHQFELKIWFAGYHLLHPPLVIRANKN